jgi:hypothetical protein
VRRPGTKNTIDDATTAQLPATYATPASSDRGRLHADAPAEDHPAEMILSAVMAQENAPPCAWRLFSRCLDRELWVVRDVDALADLMADGAVDGLPVVLADELPHLRHLDTVTLGAILDTKIAFGPGTRVVDLEPETEP